MTQKWCTSCGCLVLGGLEEKHSLWHAAAAAARRRRAIRVDTALVTCVITSVTAIVLALID